MKDRALRITIADHVFTACAQDHIARQADAGLLNGAGFAGDGDPVRCKLGVHGEEGVFDQVGGKGHTRAQRLKKRRLGNLQQGSPRERKEIGWREPRTNPVFAPLVSDRRCASHDVDHRPNLGRRWACEFGWAVVGPAVIVLWPKPMQDPTIARARRALWIALCLAFVGAPVR